MAVDVPLFTVFIAAFITALATGLGALPFAVTSLVSERWIGIGSALAAGMMSAASVGLIAQGWESNAGTTMIGAIIGVVLIYFASRSFQGQDAVQRIAEEHLGLLQSVLIVGVMTLHSFAEGIGVGVSFGETQEFGLYISLAIAVHNIPEGLAISLVLIPRGYSLGKAAGWSIFSSLPQPLMAIPAFMFVSAFASVLPVGLGIAAGAMLWMVAFQMLPEARHTIRTAPLIGVFAGSFAAMSVMQIVIST